PETQDVLMSHGDRVVEIPEGFHVVATSPNSPFAAVENTERNIYGIQFHPEVRHSVYGTDMLRNFALNICGAKGDWS
ncbi:gamma-glutamyl-gamma-aminobutyrate hydrolase family protein, partial [Vibrio cholerae O1]|nr:gamma-glutamyl-gamma-aminobutyrate hydrolase family protein [Vibrio cholerae O1]